MPNSNQESSYLLIIVIVLGCVVAILTLSLAVTCACLCRRQSTGMKAKVAKGQTKKKSTADDNEVTTKGQKVDGSLPKQTDDVTIKPSFTYFYRKPDTEAQHVVTRVKVNEIPTHFGTSAINWSSGYQPCTLPSWPRIAMSGAATASNCGWNPAHEGRVLNATPRNVQQWSSVVPVCVGGVNQAAEFRPSQAERIVLNAVPTSYGQGEGTRANLLYPVLS